jgi:4-hydroxybenzoate polyprenyltransferase
MMNDASPANPSPSSALTRGGQVRALLVAMRPGQWMKNLLVLAPVLFSENVFNRTAIARGIFAFATFCVVSSSSYLINDLKDLEQDRLHPLKQHRPLAGGALSSRTAVFGACVLALTGFAASFWLSRSLALVVATYWIINLAYTLVLKRHVILDVFAIASGYVLRPVAGALVIRVELSTWLLICTTLLALFLAFGKRRSEMRLLKEMAGQHRHVLEEYSQGFLDMMIGVVAASTVSSYAFYTVSEDTIQRFHTRRLLVTLPFVLYGIFRYLYLLYHKERGGDPLETAFTDRSMIVNLLLWVGAVALILYSR